MFTLLLKCAQVESFLIKSLKKNFLTKNMRHKYSNKFFKLSIIVIIINLKSCTEILNLRTFCLKVKMMNLRLKLSILVYQRFATQKILVKLKDSKQELELLIIFPLKFWLEIMIKCVICGLLDVYFTFFCVVIHLFMEMMIKKFYKQFKKGNLILTEKNGLKFLKRLRI